MAPKFGTSGLRGLVNELTDDLVAAHVAGFVGCCATNGRVFVGRDLRASSPRIAAAVIGAVRAAGLDAIDCGPVSTPALALAASGHGAVMVTGSHIPDDRNGLKFYAASGEITKLDELAITAALRSPAVAAPVPGGICQTEIAEAYASRYVDAFGDAALDGMVIGAYDHSSVARDILAEVLTRLGAQVVRLGRSERFVPVDTEAVDPATARQLRDWAAVQRLDAIVSTDGDGDRPLLADAGGVVVPGDLLGLLTARVLGARVVVTPLSSTTALELCGDFDIVHRTRIGSPHVIAGINAVLARDPQAKVVGFEANGGFLLGYHAALPGGDLAPLMTRDSLLPLIATLVQARGVGLAALLARLPRRATSADRLQGVDATGVATLLVRLDADPALRLAVMGGDGATIDRRDGLRVTMADGTIVHLRGSGNAPELRCYVEADTAEAAKARVAQVLRRVAQAMAN